MQGSWAQGGWGECEPGGQAEDVPPMHTQIRICQCLENELKSYRCAEGEGSVQEGPWLSTSFTLMRDSAAEKHILGPWEQAVPPWFLPGF